MTTISIEDLAKGGLFTEKVIIDPNADSFAIAPPVDDGKYVMLLTKPFGDTPFVQGGTSEAKEYGGVMRPAQQYIRVAVGYHVESFLDPSADNSKLKGRKLNLEGPDFSTFVTIKEGKPTSSATTLLKYLGINLPVDGNGRFTASVEQIAQAVVQSILGGNARVWGRTVWRGGWKAGSRVVGASDQYGKFQIYGQEKFPLMADGKTHNPVVVIDNEEKRASAYVAEIGSLKPGVAA